MSPPLLATDGQVQIIGAPTIPHPPSRPEKKPPTSRWEHRYLGEDRFPRALSALEIEHFFTLDEDELAAVRQRRSALNGLALALQVGVLRMTGRTLNSVELIPSEVLDHLGRQLGCPPPRLASIRAFYRRRRRTLFEHQAAHSGDCDRPFRPKVITDSGDHDHAAMPPKGAGARVAAIIAADTNVGCIARYGWSRAGDRRQSRP